MIVDDLYYETFDGTTRAFLSNISDVLFDAVRLSDTAAFIYTVTYRDMADNTNMQVFKDEENALGEYALLMGIIQDNLDNKDNVLGGKEDDI